MKTVRESPEHPAAQRRARFVQLSHHGLGVKGDKRGQFPKRDPIVFVRVGAAHNAGKQHVARIVNRLCDRQASTNNEITASGLAADNLATAIRSSCPENAASSVP